MASARWIDLRDHFTEVYEAYLVKNAGSLAQHRYKNNMVVPSLPMPGVSADDNSLNLIRDGFASHTIVFNFQAQRQGNEIGNLETTMMEMGASHQQQLHQMEVNMAHMAHNTGGPVSKPTTINTMTQVKYAPALAYAAPRYMVPPVHVPPAATSTIATERCSIGCRTGF